MSETALPYAKIAVLNALLQARGRGISSKILAAQVGISPQLANYHLLRLAREGLASRTLKKFATRGESHVRYAITPEGKAYLDNLLTALSGACQEPETRAEVIDLDFQNLQTIFRQFGESIKPLVPPVEWEWFTFRRTAVAKEIEKLRQIMKIRMARREEIP